MSHQILTIGAATRDIFLVSDKFFAIRSNASETGVMECMSLGSKIEIQKFYATTGGGATNAAATFRSLGFKTAILCRIGDDATGRDVLEDLKAHKIETLYVNKMNGGQTAYSTLLTMPEGERTVLVYRGVSSTFTDADVHWSAIKKAKWIYLSSLGGNLDLSKKIIDFAHKHHVRVAWNPGSAELKKGYKAFAPTLPHVDVFILNKEEGELMTGADSIKKLSVILKQEGLIRLITDGSRGTTLLDGEHSYHIGTSGTKGISKTGAGDAFGSGFVAALIEFNDPLKAAKVGTLNAESVIQHLGAKKGILTEWPSESKMKKIKISN